MPLSTEEAAVLWGRLEEYISPEEAYRPDMWAILERALPADAYADLVFSPARMRYEARIAGNGGVFFGRSRMDYAAALALALFRFLNWTNTKDEYALDIPGVTSELLYKNLELRDSRKKADETPATEEDE